MGRERGGWRRGRWLEKWLRMREVVRWVGEVVRSVWVRRVVWAVRDVREVVWEGVGAVAVRRTVQWRRSVV